MAASGNAATVYFKPNLNYNGSDSFTDAAVDNNGTQDATPATASITVNAVNDAPAVANAIADQNATQGSAFSFQFALNTFNDVDVGDTLTYTATLDTNAPLPAWLSFNASTRTFSGTPGAGDVSTITVKVTATDGSSASVSDIFSIVVGNTNDAPVLNAGATPVLTAENEDAGAPVGAVGTLVSSLVNLNPPAGSLDNVTDADSGALTGIALTATNTTNGTLFYSTNNGASWTAAGAVATARRCCWPPMLIPVFTSSRMRTSTAPSIPRLPSAPGTSRAAPRATRSIPRRMAARPRFRWRPTPPISPSLQSPTRLSSSSSTL